MKLMIASDIHGSAAWCDKLLEAVKEEKPDRLLLLGDLLYHGPRNRLPDGYDPQKVAAALNEIRGMILCVRGNCEAEVDQMMLQFPVLAEYALIYVEGTTVFASHGHHFNINTLPNLQKGDVLLYGHTHVPLFERRDGIFCVNPGSVSIPKEGSGHLYLVMEDGVLRWKDLERGEVRKETLMHAD